MLKFSRHWKNERIKCRRCSEFAFNNSWYTINISSSQTAISSLVDELENLNSSDSDLLAQLNATQNYLDSLESDLNTTIADLISEIDWANDTANWANSTLRLPYMDLRNAVFVNAHLVGADFRHADLTGADLMDANLT